MKSDDKLRKSLEGDKVITKVMKKKMVFENWTEYNKQLVNQQFFYKSKSKD